MSTFKMAVPSGFPATFVAKSGRTYSASNGVIASVNTQDLADMFAMGCTVTDDPDEGIKVCGTQLDRATSTTLTDIPDLAVNLTAGATYRIRGHITGTATVNGGAKAALGADATLTATSLTATFRNYNGKVINDAETVTALDTAAAGADAVMTDIDVDGVIEVDVGGVLSLQIAQNSSHADTTSAKVGSYLEVTRVS